VMAWCLACATDWVRFGWGAVIDQAFSASGIRIV
jgi:hypothetical protein